MLTIGLMLLLSFLLATLVERKYQSHYAAIFVGTVGAVIVVHLTSFAVDGIEPKAVMFLPISVFVGLLLSAPGSIAGVLLPQIVKHGANWRMWFSPNDTTLCPQCGYSLYGLPHNKCPECGARNSNIRVGRPIHGDSNATRDPMNDRPAGPPK